MNSDNNDNSIDGKADAPPLTIGPHNELTASSTPQSSLFTPLTFTQGFLLGQTTVLVILFAFVRFFIFGDTTSDAHPTAHLTLRARTAVQPSGSHSSHSNSSAAKPRRASHGPSASDRPLSAATILEKTFYNVQGHQPETLDWFNVLIAQTIAHLRDDARAAAAIITDGDGEGDGSGTGNALLDRVKQLLNASRPSWLDTIHVTELVLGEDFPIFSNCRIIREGKGEGEGTGDILRANMDVDLSDAISVAVSTKIVLNIPRPRAAVLPVELEIEIVRFSGTVSDRLCNARAGYGTWRERDVG